MIILVYTNCIAIHWWTIHQHCVVLVILAKYGKNLVKSNMAATGHKLYSGIGNCVIIDDISTGC